MNEFNIEEQEYNGYLVAPTWDGSEYMTVYVKDLDQSEEESIGYVQTTFPMREIMANTLGATPRQSWFEFDQASKQQAFEQAFQEWKNMYADQKELDYLHETMADPRLAFLRSEE
jgi:hypothetical protein